jgi:hypothetical protein
MTSFCFLSLFLSVGIVVQSVAQINQIITVIPAVVPTRVVYHSGGSSG